MSAGNHAAFAVATRATSVNIVPPVGYSAWWAVLGVALVLVAAAVVVMAIVFTRPKPTDSDPLPPLFPHSPPRTVRDRYLDELNALERRYAEGDIDEKAVHLELSSQMKSYASTRLGIDTQAMTLTDIENLRGAEELRSIISNNYWPSFADIARDPFTHPVDPHRSIEQAREVVRRW